LFGGRVRFAAGSVSPSGQAEGVMRCALKKADRGLLREKGELNDALPVI